MAEYRRYIPIQHLDLAQILQEAQHRWLRPAEICEILRNYQKFQLTPDPPVRPPAGSLFLFDRKALRYFRKDGHRWRKKKDGKTVKEAHEKLKAGSVDALHCYYAHGEDNENFQRRSYWMLDGRLEHIVLVHYREVKEGYRSGVSRFLADPASHVASPQSASLPGSVQETSPLSAFQTSYASSPSGVEWHGQTFLSVFEDVDSSHDQAVSLSQPVFGSSTHNVSVGGQVNSGFPEISINTPGSWCARPTCIHSTGPSIYNEVCSSKNNTNTMHEQKPFVEKPFDVDLIAHKITDAGIDHDIASYENKLVHDADVPSASGASHRVRQVVKSNIRFEKESKGSVDNMTVELKKLDSFGRWMDKEIGGDCNASLMASDSGNYWGTLDADNDDKEVSSLSRHMQLDIDSLCPSISQDQLFSICDFSPEWSYSGTETKVLIVGSFLGSKKLSGETKWGCMFGEIEVYAEVLTDNVLRCQTPLHAPGRVPFYVTCSNRLACSEVREFEYREKTTGIAVRSPCAPEEEMRFQMRLTSLLNLGPERKWLDCSNQDCEKCRIERSLKSLRSKSERDWERIKGSRNNLKGHPLNSREVLIESLLKDKLFEWLLCKVHEGGSGLNALDDDGQGVIHLAASLGYEWAIGPLVGSGISPNFRDKHGRTGLHWASYFGREETVIALVRYGASPGAVEDPTPAYPGGRTAADLASSRGYKGIAGYLAEADLASHLTTLNVNGNVTDDVTAALAVEEATTSAEQSIATNMAADELHCLKGSLAAVRKSAHAAALIHAAFRAHSFRYRQLSRSSDDISEASLDLVALGSLNKVQKTSHYEDYLHGAAVRIQQKYRGWKGRKEFLKIRNHIVKIQAHVRGHQVRKQYKKVVWSVSIVEKAILRWRRKRAGLRGFRVEKASGTVSSEIERSDEYEFLRIGRKLKYAGVEKALARVKSMARHPEARDQYMRLITKFQSFKVSDEESFASQQFES